ncbi:Hydrophobin 2 [Mycena venus]|uniref:Hydrophobin n=1 Tax=Mycena venus TaxID=2733690 RepID=A0A8H7CNA3_9AGAR|nr:Hydrophobin 2 [Mycena venus]
MFSKLSVVVASVLIVRPHRSSIELRLISIADPCCRHAQRHSPPPPVTPPTSTQCCSSVQSSSSTAVGLVAALLGLDLSGLNVPIGLSCSPITVIGNNCGGTTVTCDAPKEEWGGLIAINCLPITA